VSNDHAETAPDPQEERVLADLKGVKWERVGKGKLLLTNKRIEFETKGGFFSSPRVAFSVAIVAILSVDFDNASNTLGLKWLDENSERVICRLSLPKGDAAANLCRSLNRALESLRVESEQHARLDRYHAFLWQASYSVWAMAGHLQQIVKELPREGWDAVDNSLSEIRELASTQPVLMSPNVASQIETLAEAVPSRDASLVLREAVASLRVLGISLNNELSPADGWGEMALMESPELNWRDVRYIFLFAAMYGLLAARQEADDTAKIQELLPRVAILSSIVTGILSPERISPSCEEGDVSSVVEASARDIEDKLKVNAGVA
jgi:hypothetical protein